jgi:hypothetical protein
MKTVNVRLQQGDFHLIDGSAQVVVRLGADRVVVLMSHGRRPAAMPLPEAANLTIDPLDGALPHENLPIALLVVSPEQIQYFLDIHQPGVDDIVATVRRLVESDVR